MFDEPLSRGSRLPESPRINSLLAGLMGTKPAPTASPVVTHLATSIPAPALRTQELIEPAQPARSVSAKTFSTFLKSIQWTYVPSASSAVVVTPGMPVREFFSMVNWSGDKTLSPSSVGGSFSPPSVENLMSQFSWD